MDTEENYLHITHTILELKLNKTELLVLAAIDGFSRGEKWCYASQDYLARLCVLTKSQVTLAIGRLEKKGLIEKRKILENNNPRCQYRTIFKNSGSKMEHGFQNETTHGFKMEPPVVSKWNPIINIYNKDDIKGTTKVVEGKPSNGKLVGLEISSESGLIPKGKPKPATSDNRNSLIEEALDIWEDVMGVRPAFEKDKTQRSYAFNIMRRKDRGGEWLRKMLILLRNAKATEYTSAKITNISDFKSLFYGVDILTQWGQSRADQKRVSKKGIIDLDNMD